MEKGFGFASELVPLIVKGEKTYTYRLLVREPVQLENGEMMHRLVNKYKCLEVEDRFLITNSSTKTPFAEIEILHKEEVHFYDIPIDREGHEPYPTKEVMRETFESYYKRKIEDDDQFLVFQFKVLKLLNTSRQP